MGRIVTLHPTSFTDARTIGEHYRDGTPVIMNLTELDDSDARRLVDFAAGLVFALRGSMDKVTNKVFLISPPNQDPTAEDKRRIAEGGFLMTYSVNFVDLYRRGAEYVSRILNGAKPADLPVEQPTRFSFIINMKTARALGVAVPPSLLLRAVEVIE